MLAAHYCEFACWLTLSTYLAKRRHKLKIVASLCIGLLNDISSADDSVTL